MEILQLVQHFYSGKLKILLLFSRALNAVASFFTVIGSVRLLGLLVIEYITNVLSISGKIVSLSILLEYLKFVVLTYHVCQNIHVSCYFFF